MRVELSNFVSNGGGIRGGGTISSGDNCSTGGKFSGSKGLICGIASGKGEGKKTEASGSGGGGAGIVSKGNLIAVCSNGILERGVLGNSGICNGGGDKSGRRTASASFNCIVLMGVLLISFFSTENKGISEKVNNKP